MASTNPTRQRRLAALKREVTAAGGQAAFARLHEGVDASYLSQIFSGHRPFGETAARTMEQKCGWKPGYLDRQPGYEDSVYAEDENERQLLTTYRKLRPDEQDMLMGNATRYLNNQGHGSGPDNQDPKSHKRVHIARSTKDRRSKGNATTGN